MDTVLLVLALFSIFYQAFPLQQSTFGSSESNIQKKAKAKPEIKNPRFEKGTLKFALAGSNIDCRAALILNGSDKYPIRVDDSGILFEVPKEAKGSESGLTIAERIADKKVTLCVENPDGSRSEVVSFKRK
ncbi:MAG: hypothetical protein RMM17_14055 [Acidobacteriota bacterium]|nr:hypothetical protein [Blastocatellia bacterium]MDW8413792.1 hypothetical protein [Acidobacteriota bacterium]